VGTAIAVGGLERRRIVRYNQLMIEEEPTLATASRGLALVIDDDDDDRALVSALLRRAGFATRELQSGADVLQAAAEERPVVVVLEVRLPGLNGYEVCRALRDAYGESVAIVFVSGERTESFDRVAGLLVGADDYMVKPFDAAELIARVLRLTDHKAPSAEPAEPLPDLTSLTRREREVLALLSEGYRQSEIATALVISPTTVGTHIQRVLKKLGVHDRAQAVALALHGTLGRLPI
jgi:DNA-binding NarL/FixJ family response regulator